MHDRMKRLEPRLRVDRALQVITIMVAGLVIQFMPDCLFLSITGLPCPMCGGTRAVTCLLRGDLEGVWVWNPWSISWVVLISTAAATWTLEAVAGKSITYPMWWSKFLWVTLLMLGVFTLALWAVRLLGIAFPWHGPLPRNAL